MAAADPARDVDAHHDPDGKAPVDAEEIPVGRVADNALRYRGISKYLQQGFT